MTVTNQQILKKAEECNWTNKQVAIHAKIFLRKDRHYKKKSNNNVSVKDGYKYAADDITKRINFLENEITRLTKERHWLERQCYSVNELAKISLNRRAEKLSW